MGLVVQLQRLCELFPYTDAHIYVLREIAKTAKGVISWKKGIQKEASPFWSNRILGYVDFVENRVFLQNVAQIDCKLVV